MQYQSQSRVTLATLRHLLPSARQASSRICHGALRDHHDHQVPAHGNLALFSSTTRHQRRHRPKRIFRLESHQERLIREHNLFDPRADGSHQTLGGSQYGHTRRHERMRRSFAQTSSSTLERELLDSATYNPDKDKLWYILDHLIVQRGDPPNASHYEALILANASPSQGSAANVEALLREMDSVNVAANVNIFTAVLRTMVVHPDAQIISRVLDSCEKMWINLDTEMLHFVAAAYLRLGMTELALDYLDKIETVDSAESEFSVSPFAALSKLSGKTDLWLYVLFIHQLALRNDWEGVMRMCYRLNDDCSIGPFALRQLDVPHRFWEWLLHKANDAGDRWVCRWISDVWVRSGWISPDAALHQSLLELLGDDALSTDGQEAASVHEKLQNHTPPTTPLGSTTDTPGLGECGQSTASSSAKQSKVVSPSSSKHGATRSTYPGTASPPKIDPWAYLTSENDTGMAWPRMQRERSEEFDRRVAVERKRQFHLKRVKMIEGLKAFPPGLLDDIQHVEACLFPHPTDLNDDGVVEVVSPTYRNSVGKVEHDESHASFSNVVKE